MTISKSNLQTCLRLEDLDGYSGILGQKQTQREGLSCLGIFFSDLLPEIEDSEKEACFSKMHDGRKVRLSLSYFLLL